MAPLRLQIVIQPRPWPSSSQSAAPESAIKWLEICHGDPTIQELSETLEARFFERNHAPLNIKILKFLDDVELYPSYKLRDIFEDIKEAKDGERSFSTIKVFRNPPTSAELADTKRFESLPPESLARPRKRPLPPLFTDTIHNGYIQTTHRPSSTLRHSPAYPGRPTKRQKVHEPAPQYFTGPDQLMQSLEVTDDRQSPYPIAGQRASPVHQVEDSQKPPHKTRECCDFIVEKAALTISAGSDPYGTPVSSQIDSHQGAQCQVADAVSLSDSPLRDTRSTSPEIPLSADPSPGLQETPAEAELPAQDPHLDRVSQPSQAQAIRATTSISSSSLAQVSLPASSLLLPNDSSAGVPKSVSPRPQNRRSKPGRLQRPKSLKGISAAKRTRKVINGIPQSTPSVFDPIDTSEGSSQERELLRSAKRSKTTVAPCTKTDTEAAEAKMASKSPSGRFLVPQKPPSTSASANPTPAAKKDSASSHPQRGSEAASEQSAATKPVVQGIQDKADKDIQKGKDTNFEADQALKRPSQLKDGAKPAASDRVPSERQDSEDLILSTSQLERYPALRHAYQGRSSHIVELSLTASGLTTDDILKQELQEAEAEKQRAQVLFDMIAAKAAEQKERNEKMRKEQEEKKAMGSTAILEATSSIREPPTESSTPFGSFRDQLSHIEPPPHGDSQAIRKYHVEHFLPAARRHFGLPEPADKARKPRVKTSTSSKKEKKASQPEAKRRTRTTRSQVKIDGVIADQETVHDNCHPADQTIAGQETEEAQYVPTKPTPERAEKDSSERIQETLGKQKQAVGYPTETVKLGQLKRGAGITEINDRPVQGNEIPGENAVEVHGQQEEQPTIQAHGPHKDMKSVEVDKLVSADAAPQSQRQMETEEGPVVSKETPTCTKLGVLGERSPKARLNAERQIQLANLWLKNKKRDSSEFGSFDAKALLSAVDSTTPALNRLQTVRPSAKKPATEQRSGAHATVRKGTAVPTPFTDSDALRAAGLYTGMPPITIAFGNTGSSSVPVGILKASSTVDLTGSGQPSRRDSAGNSSTHGCRSSKQPEDPTSSDLVRTMTPAIPSTSMKSDPDSAEVKAVSARRAASAASRLSKTPMRSALQRTPTELRRSVSFADGPNSSSQPISTAPTPAVQRSPKKKGIFQRALEEANALDKAKKKPMKTKQTKMTPHIHRDLKLKGKEIDRSIPHSSQTVETISLSSASEASTFFSDESEGTRNARPGPSSRKRVKARQKRPSDTPATRISCGWSNAHGDGSRSVAARVKMEESYDAAEASWHTQGPTIEGSGAVSKALISGKSSASASEKFSKPCSPKPISNVSPGSDHESNDSLSLLPAAEGPKEILPKVSQRSQQKPALISEKHDKANQHPFTVQAPRTPLDQTQVAQAARLAKDRQLGHEAEQQLLREHNQALQAAVTPNIHHENENTKTGAKGNRAKANQSAKTRFEGTSLSKLREVQAAQPLVMQRAKVSDLDSTKAAQSAPNDWTSSSGSSNESSGSTSDAMEPAQLEAKLQQKATPSKPKGLTKALKELFGRP
ncbi:MAG: hypothetical protein Q9218_001133 [Villophora microphyllina]